MTGGMKYGDIALGIECALPAGVTLIHHASRTRRLMTWLLTALARRA